MRPVLIRLERADLGALCPAIVGEVEHLRALTGSRKALAFHPGRERVGLTGNEIHGGLVEVAVVGVDAAHLQRCLPSVLDVCNEFAVLAAAEPLPALLAALEAAVVGEVLSRQPDRCEGVLSGGCGDGGKHRRCDGHGHHHPLGCLAGHVCALLLLAVVGAVGTELAALISDLRDTIPNYRAIRNSIPSSGDTTLTPHCS